MSTRTTTAPTFTLPNDLSIYPEFDGPDELFEAREIERQEESYISTLDFAEFQSHLAHQQQIESVSDLAAYLSAE